MTPWRTRRTGQLEEADIGRKMTLCGFVETHRDHKHQVFMHLRDGSGKLQVVFDGDRDAALFELARHVPTESVVQVSGVLVRRPEGADRTSLDASTIELEAATVRVVSRAPAPPFSLAPGEREKVDENLRLSQRYFELRSEDLRRSLAGRAKMVSALRRAFEDQDFLEIETPTLTRQSPEGAREFLVPSRNAPGSVFALAQSPQLYKQMLMVGGIERYYQVARCFRDEDGRANRQPEFTQLDFECAYATEEEIRGVVETAVVAAAAALGVALPSPFPILPWSQAIERFGIDRPDLRFDMSLVDATDVARASGFKKLREAVAGGGRAGLFRVPVSSSTAGFSNAELDRVREDAMRLGAPGLLWFRREGDRLRSDPFVERLLAESERAELARRAGGADGDAVFLLAAPAGRLTALFASLRARLARRHDLARPGEMRACWVVRFPFFEPGTRAPSHHPFTSPADPEQFAAEFSSARPGAEPGSWESLAYDLVINGEEIGSGSIRIHDAVLQRLVFRLLGYTDEAMEERFGFFLRALASAAPPHGGMALGIDRLFMTLTGREDLRDVIAFPKALDHSDPLTGAPAPPAGA